MAKILILIGFLVSSCCQADIQLLIYNNPPLVSLRGGKPPTGLSVNLTEALFTQANVPYDFAEYPPRRALYYAATRSNTCAFPVDRTQDKEVNYRWIGPVSINRYAFYSTPERDLSLITLQDAKPYRIAVFAGTAMGNYLKQNDFMVYENNAIEQGLQMLLHNHIDLWVADTHSAQSLAKKYNVTSLEPTLIFFTTITFIACNPQLPDQVFQKLKGELRSMYLSGQAQQILDIELY